MTQDQMNNLADSLDEMQNRLNPKMGISFVRGIIFYLRRGDLKSAKAIAYNDFDKSRQYKGLSDYLKQTLIPNYPYSIN